MAADEVDGGLTVRVAVLEATMAQLAGTVTRVLDRLLDATLPPILPAIAPSTYDQDTDIPAADWVTQDWTDPFMGLEERDYREVGRLEPGEPLPYLPPADAPPGTPVAATIGDTGALDRWRQVGEGSFDEWNRETHQPETGAREALGWVAPLDLGDVTV